MALQHASEAPLEMSVRLTVMHLQQHTRGSGRSVDREEQVGGIQGLISEPGNLVSYSYRASDIGGAIPILGTRVAQVDLIT